MPRRLGDDPLSRARAAKAAMASTPAVPSSEGQVAASEPDTLSSSRAPSNDVFFQRRVDGGGPLEQAAASTAAQEKPEISEISEIPEIREVVAAPQPQTGSDVAALPEARPEPVVPSAAGALVVESAAPDAPEAAPAEPVPPGPPEVPQPPDGSVVEPEPQPQRSGGFLKRLFGKFK